MTLVINCGHVLLQDEHNPLVGNHDLIACPLCFLDYMSFWVDFTVFKCVQLPFSPQRYKKLIKSKFLKLHAKSEIFVSS